MFFLIRFAAAPAPSFGLNALASSAIERTRVDAGAKLRYSCALRPSSPGARRGAWPRDDACAAR